MCCSLPDSPAEPEPENQQGNAEEPKVIPHDEVLLHLSIKGASYRSELQTGSQKEGLGEGKGHRSAKGPEIFPAQSQSPDKNANNGDIMELCSPSFSVLEPWSPAVLA